MEATLQAEVQNNKIALRAASLVFALRPVLHKGNGLWSAWLRATPSPSHSPCRMAGQSATCNTTAKDFPDWWSGRRGIANQRRPGGQGRFKWQRLWQLPPTAALRSAATVSVPSAFSSFSLKPCLAHPRSTAAQCARCKTGLLSFIRLRPPPERQAALPSPAARLAGRWFSA